MKTFKNKVSGFTLVELLVVIAIIAILSSTILASLNAAKEKSKLARVKADKESVELSLEVFYSDWGGYPYKENGGDGGLYCIAPNNVPDCLFMGNTISARLNTIPNISEAPQDVRTTMTAAAAVAFPQLKNEYTFNTADGAMRGIVYMQCPAVDSHGNPVPQTINGVKVCPVDSLSNDDDVPVIIYPTVTEGVLTTKSSVPGEDEDTDFVAP